MPKAVIWRHEDPALPRWRTRSFGLDMPGPTEAGWPESARVRLVPVHLPAPPLMARDGSLSTLQAFLGGTT
jgi:hypothetical protein